MERIMAPKPQAIIKHFIGDDGTFPNNSLLPLLVYKNVLQLSDKEKEAAALWESLFKQNKWKNSWKDGIYNFHHYHSTAHEVLGVYKAESNVQFGGDRGIVLRLEKADVIIIPAGVAHKNLDLNSEFKCVGAYPEGQDYDMNYGKGKERPKTDENIRKVPLPEFDPVYGNKGPLTLFWLKEKSHIMY